MSDEWRSTGVSEPTSGIRRVVDPRLLGLAVLLVLCALPRFGRPAAGPLASARPGDSVHYVAMTEALRAGESLSGIEAPWRWRPLVPALAAALPREPR